MRTTLAVVTVALFTVLTLASIANAQAPRRTLVIGMPVTPPNLPHVGVYIAKDLGYFDEEGINVEFAQFESGLQALRGGVAGGLDILGPAVNRSSPLSVVGRKSEASSAMLTSSPWSWLLRRTFGDPPICGGRTLASRRSEHSARL